MKMDAEELTIIKELIQDAIISAEQLEMIKAIPKGGENKRLYVEELLKDEIALFGKGKARALIEAAVREMKNRDVSIARSLRAKLKLKADKRRWR